MEPRLIQSSGTVELHGRSTLGEGGKGIKANTSARLSIFLFPFRAIADRYVVVVQATIAASIDRARRKSLQFQPKSSPISLLPSRESVTDNVTSSWLSTRKTSIHDGPNPRKGGRRDVLILPLYSSFVVISRCVIHVLCRVCIRTLAR